MLSQLFHGWRLTAFLALVVSFIALPILVFQGISEDSLRQFLRTTARCSVLLFLTAFSASGLVRLHTARWTKWLARNRRYIGVGFAFSHTLHLAAILWLMKIHPGMFSNTEGRFVMIFGGLAFVFLYAMTATSFDRTAAWIGARNWRLLHKTGMYYFWLIFFLDYVLPGVRSVPHVPFAVLVIAVMVVRILAWRKKKQVSAGKKVSIVSMR